MRRGVTKEEERSTCGIILESERRFREGMEGEEERKAPKNMIFQSTLNDYVYYAVSGVYAGRFPWIPNPLPERDSQFKLCLLHSHLWQLYT